MHTDARTTVNGIPLTDTDQATTLDAQLPTAPSSANTVTGTRFKSGAEWRGNAAGRPRKGESLPELLTREYEKQKRKLVQAAVKRALREDQVGNRAFNDGLDRVYGKVADEMHITAGESPLAALLMRHNARVVEGEARVVDDNEP